MKLEDFEEPLIDGIYLEREFIETNMLATLRLRL